MSRSPNQSGRASPKRRGFSRIVAYIALLAVVGTAFLLLEQRKDRVRWAAYQGRVIVTEWGPDLNSGDPSVRKRAIDTLCEASRDENPYVRIAALQTLSRFPDFDTDLTIFASLIEALKDSEPRVRQSAAEPLRNFGIIAKPDAPQIQAGLAALSAALEDSEPLVREYAAGALFNLGVESETILPIAIGALHNENARVREPAAHFLRDYEPPARAAIAQLNASLSDSDIRARTAAASALWNLDPGPETAAAILPVLRESLSRIQVTHALTPHGC